MTERPNTVAGLIDKRREIAGQVEAAEETLRGLVASLAALDATIRLFDPNADLGRPKKQGIAHAAFRGEMARFVLTALREAKGDPQTTLEIARFVMKRRGIEDTPRMTVVTRKRVVTCLSKLRRKGVVRDVPMAGEYKGWVLSTNS
jgi:hypothetical protein